MVVGPQTLIEYNKMPDFSRYLLYVVVGLPGEQDATRSMAGIVLKNNIKALYSMIHPSILEDIKGACIKCIGDPKPLVRATIGLLVTTMVQCGKLNSWPDLIPNLLHLIGPQNEPTVHEGASWALHKVCEDCTHELDVPRPDEHDATGRRKTHAEIQAETIAASQSPLAIWRQSIRTQMIANFIEFLGHPNPTVRAQVSSLQSKISFFIAFLST